MNIYIVMDCTGEPVQPVMVTHDKIRAHVQAAASSIPGVLAPEHEGGLHAVVEIGELDELIAPDSGDWTFYSEGMAE